ncbi:MAG: hypothetical protein A2Z91_08140 [Deltaproteobacteria bacterium GWA2_38_16]|nr:MAG: hypothetical protein A2Z91_08140 [Deltaproteobacteria bacterium GWA2_38_16]OGQ01877.1 MAG: hypothetical protein A3D19_03150 [Deltaproteobacteria bacterium RIFCSPHIGHO2_02_FULL_38_15]OGQ29936.1 MAG: hypothetical protein A3A72_05820 [Deltaproteobacteria bacterium RIFCSPLOWO2_01_FULL_38_9]HBQ20768.1 16S rRNA (uracil(1498)-N(3))-methyltransferase [Deltaproteobacteria bacterium]
MSRVFVKEELKENSTLTLTGEIHHYLTHVLRMKIGDPLCLFNGGNQEFLSTISEIQKNKITLHISTAQTVNKESPLEIIIGQAIPKGQKLDDLIPKITELGVSKVVPLITERSDLKTASPQKLVRWQKIAEYSSQQTGRTKVPEISTPLSFNHFLKKYPNHEKILFYELENSKNLHDVLKTTTSQKFCLIIGPEGGFTPQEIALAQKENCTIISLGKRILRTETVAPLVTGILQYVKGDLNTWT